MINLESGAWRKIAEQLVTEPDTAKLLALVEQLNKEMDREDSVRQATLIFIRTPIAVWRRRSIPQSAAECRRRRSL